MTPEEFRQQGHAVVDWIADYYSHIESFPVLSRVKPGEVRFKAGGETKLFAVSGGFAEIRADKVALFAETAEMAESIDAERARQALERAQTELLGKNLDSMTLAHAEAAMRRAQVRLRVAQLRSVRRR